MIRIAPYDDPQRSNSQEILEYYLNLVADVVPFRPEDVLDGITPAPDSTSYKPRTRTSEYRKLLEAKVLKPGKSEKNDEATQRTNDALLAQELIRDYSTDLYHALYEDGEIGSQPGAVNRTFLRKLFLTRFPHGKIEEQLDYYGPEKLKTNLNIKPPQNVFHNLYKYVFCYDDFSKKKNLSKKTPDRPPRDVFRFVDMLGVEVCPYCNRQFITTIAYGDKRVRPQLDHFRNKKDYPHLALSINNLIPSCAVCNLLKHDKDTNMLYPYDEGIDDNYVFRAECIGNDITDVLTGTRIAPQKFTLKLQKNTNNDEEHTIRADNSINILALDKLYNSSHKGYVSDLFFQRYVLTDEYVEDIITQFPKLFKTKDEVKHMLQLMDYSPEKWEHRPLAKLTHDIDEQIDELQATLKNKH